MRRLLFYSLVGLFILILVIAITSYAIIANLKLHPGEILVVLVALAVGIGTLIKTILEIIKINRGLPQKEPALISSTSQSISPYITQTEPQNIIADTLPAEKIAGTTIENQYIQNLLDSIPSPLFPIPDPPADFTGREVELNDFLRAVESRGLIIAGGAGSGGVGKTALAYKFAQSIASYYPDAQIYLDLRGAHEQRPLLPSEAMSSVVHAYQPDIKLPENEIELQALYRSVLQNQHALLLLDNARDSQQVESLIPPNGCLLLVTSDGHFTLPGMKIYILESLPAEYAEQLLRKIAPRTGEYAGRLAGLCGCLPLALRVAARSLRERPDLPLPDYLARLEELERRLELTGVEVTIQLSYDLLDGNLQRYFRLLAVFPGSFDRAAAASVWELEGSSAADFLGELLRFNLIEYNSLTRRFKLHDLTRLFAGKLLEEEKREAALKLHAGHYLEVLSTADQFYRQGGDALKAGLALFDLEWGNIQAGHAWSVENAAQDESASRWCVDYPTAGSNIINTRLHSTQIIAWQEAAVESAHRVGDRRSEGNWLSSLGNACREMGQLEQAIEYYQQALAISREIGDLRWEAADLSDLGNACYDLGQMKQAIEYHHQALLISRALGDRSNEGNHLGNLGNAYREMGQVRLAIENYEQALDIARQTGDRRGEGIRLGNLGNAYSDLRQVEQAIGYYARALAIARETGDRRAEGSHLCNLGNAYRDLEHMEQARVYLKQALKIFEEIKSPDAQKVREWLSEIG